VIVAAGLLLAAAAAFTPPLLVSGEPSGLPPVTVIGGGEVLVEATVDKSGALAHAILLRDTPPYGQMVLDAVSRWRFTPARATGDDGVDRAVDASMLIVAMYRPPNLFNNPTLGTPPADLGRPSSETPYPLTLAMPGHPPQAASGGVVMLEVSLDETGIVRGVHPIRSNPAFDAAARGAVDQWKFRGASVRSVPVPSTVYVILGFPQPVLKPPSK
jgi:TonB family protein